MIVDASVAIDAVADPGPRGVAARQQLEQVPAAEGLRAPGHFAVEVMSGLHAAAGRPNFRFTDADIPQALTDAKALGIRIEVIPWEDVDRAWELATQSMRYADAIYVAAAERNRTALLTSDQRIERSGADIRCQIITVRPLPDPDALSALQGKYAGIGDDTETMRRRDRAEEAAYEARRESQRP